MAELRSRFGMCLGAVISALRRKGDLTQAGLAPRIRDISQPQMSRMEAGYDRALTIGRIQLLCEIMEIPIENLILRASTVFRATHDLSSEEFLHVLPAVARQVAEEP